MGCSLTGCCKALLFWIPVILMSVSCFGGALACLFQSIDQSIFYLFCFSGSLSICDILSRHFKLGSYVDHSVTALKYKVTSWVRRCLTNSPACHYPSTGSHHPIIKRFPWRHLHYCLVMHCCRPWLDALLLGWCIQQHHCWRRRTAHWARKSKIKQQAAFQWGVPRATYLWKSCPYVQCHLIYKRKYTLKYPNGMITCVCRIGLQSMVSGYIWSSSSALM